MTHANVAADFLQAHAVGVKHRLHDASLWTGEPRARKFCFQGTPKDLSNLAHIPFDSSRHIRQWVDAISYHIGQSQDERDYRTLDGLLVRCVRMAKSPQ